MDLIIIIVSLVIFCALVWAAISAAIALAHLADEAAKLRRILGILAETQLARGDNEIASIQAANGLAESVRLHSMPDPHGQNTQSSMRPPSKLSNEVRSTRLDAIMRQ